MMVNADLVGIRVSKFSSFVLFSFLFFSLPGFQRIGDVTGDYDRFCGLRGLSMHRLFLCGLIETRHSWVFLSSFFFSRWIGPHNIRHEVADAL